ncbi:MAG: DUF1993 family protein [Lautropia sp.]
MSLSMFEATVPPMTRMLGNLADLLRKGAAHAEAKRFDPVVLLQQRLHPDQFALPRQVQVACDTAKLAVARLTARTAPQQEDNEASFAELQSRIGATITWIETATPQSFEGSETRIVEIKRRDDTLRLVGADYLTRFALPNFHFHVAMAYAILRHNGVDLGKSDYLGRFDDLTPR